MRQRLMLPGSSLKSPRRHKGLFSSARLWPALLLLAFTSASVSGETSSQAAASAVPASAPGVERGLDGATLAALLSADIAAQRGQSLAAVRLYLELSERLGEPALAERATRLARFTENVPLVLESARRWAQLAPDNPAPRRLLAGESAERGDWATTLSLLLEIEASGHDAGLIAFIEEAVSSGATPEVLESILDNRLAEHPNEAQAYVARAYLKAMRGDDAGTDEDLARARSLDEGLPTLWLLKSQIALDRGRPLESLEHAQKGQALAPEDQRFLLAGAQAHLALDDVEAAEAQFERLLESVPENVELRLTLGRLYLQNDYPQAAWRLLAPLIEQPDEETPSAEPLMLAALASARSDALERALDLYARVPEGDHFMNARARGAQFLLAEQGLEPALRWLSRQQEKHPDAYAELLSLSLSLLDQNDLKARADRKLSEAIEARPNDDHLLYMRAIRALERDDLAAMEEDMTRLLERDPNNAEALNAWGYTLLQRTDRLDEALTLLERAHRLAPEAPAILDSLGWALFKAGELDRALSLLKQAYQGLPDEEVAAHLIEALWANGESDRARQLAAQALSRFERRPTLDELLSRYPLLAPEGFDTSEQSELPDSLENTP